MKKNNEKFPSRYVPYYLVDAATGDYEELNLRAMRKRLNRSDVFIYDHCKSKSMFIIDERGYYLTDNFGEIWYLI